MKYRKRPVIIDADVYRRGLEDGWGCLRSSCITKNSQGHYKQCLEVGESVGCGDVPYIDTLEGKLWITEGDYVITVIQGERYPCKPEIFLATYEEVTEC